MHCEVTLRIPQQALTQGEQRHSTFKKGRELASTASMTAQGSRFDDLRGILTERYFGDLDAAAEFAREVSAHLTKQQNLASRVTEQAGEFIIELRITGYCGIEKAR